MITLRTRETMRENYKSFCVEDNTAHDGNHLPPRAYSSLLRTTNKPRSMLLITTFPLGKYG